MGGGVYDPHHMYSNYQSRSNCQSYLYIYIYIRCGGAIVNLFKIYLGLHFHLKKSLCKVREILKEEGRKGRL